MKNPTPLPSEIDLEKMFAYMEIQSWEREIKGSTSDIEIKKIAAKIQKSSIRHGFVTKYTSMVVTEEPPEALKKKMKEKRKKSKGASFGDPHFAIKADGQESICFDYQPVAERFTLIYDPD